MKLAHISDLHILHLRETAWYHFLSKRIIGMTNLILNRSREYKIEYVEKLIQDLKEYTPDHVALTGDITNLAFPSEYEKAIELLSEIGGPEKLSPVPGNHDHYTPESYRYKRFNRMMGRWLKSDIPLIEDRGKNSHFPYVKFLPDNVALIGLSSSIPTCFFCSAGNISAFQLAELDRMLQMDQLKNRFKIVMIHHHLEDVPRVQRFVAGVRNRRKLINCLTRNKVDMLLHGHRHINHHYTIDANNHTLNVYECGASARRSENHPGTYNIYEIVDGKLKSVTHRRLNPHSLNFETVNPET